MGDVGWIAYSTIPFSWRRFWRDTMLWRHCTCPYRNAP